MRRALYITGAALLLALLAAISMYAGRLLGGSSMPEETASALEIEFYQQREEAVAGFAKVMDLYAQDHSGTSILQETIPNSLMALLSRVQQGDAPTLFTHWPTQHTFIRMQESGVMLALTDQSWLASVDEKSLALCTMEDGSIYALPLNRNCLEVFYNKSLFEEHGLTAPQTMDELVSICDTLAAAGIAPFVFCARDASRSSHAAQGILAALLPDYSETLARLGSGEITAPEEEALREALSLLYTFSSKYALQNEDIVTVYDAYDKLARGDCAMMIVGSYAASGILGRDPVGEISIFPLPGKTPGDRRIISSIDTAVSIAAGAPPAQREAALDFLAFLSDPEIAGEYARLDIAPSCVKDVQPTHPLMREMQEHIETLETVEWLKHRFQQEICIAFDNGARLYMVDGDLEGFMRTLRAIFNTTVEENAS